MASTGIKQENMKLQNRRAILELLNEKERLSRKDISMQIGLTPAAVTQLVNEMIEEGILLEYGQAQEIKKRVGRKKVLLGINFDSRLILAVSVEVDATTVSLCNLRGTALRQTSISTDAGLAPEAFLNRVAEEARALARDCPAEQVLGMGVTVTGPVNRALGTSLSAFNLWQHPVAVGEILKKTVPYPVILENNIKAFAEAELIYGLGRHAGNLLFFKWGPGVGSAIAVDQEVYPGRNQMGSELGHYIVDPNGAPCVCGRRGCLETLITVRAVHAALERVLSKENTPLLYESLGGVPARFTEAWFESWIRTLPIEKPGAADPAVQRILNRSLQHAATALANTITVLAPDRVVLFGSMLKNPAMVQALVQKCDQANAGAYPGENIALSPLYGAFRYIGPAAVVARERFFNAAGLV